MQSSDGASLAKRIQIFRVGTHTAMDGKSYDFTEQMLREAITAYDPALYDAPLVVGHPEMNAPAYGSVKSLHLASDGQTIEVEPCEVDPAFSELVNAGRYKKVSASWYLPAATGNPKPGSLYLRHVGFLGAQPPAIKGLKSASFSDSQEGVAEFADWADTQNASLWRRMREFIIEKFSMDEADRVLPDYQIQSLEQNAREPAPTSISYAEHSEQDAMTPEELTAAQDKLAADQAALQAAQRKLQADQVSFAERESAQAKAARHAEHSAFIEGLVKECKVRPVQQARLVAFMDSLDVQGVIEFAEGDKAVKENGLDVFRAYLKAQPPLVEFGEHNTGEEPLDTENAQALADAATKYHAEQAQAGKTISFSEAMAHVTKGQQ